MPEQPDITVYREALEQRIVGARLTAVRLGSPFLLRTVDPAISSAEGRTVTAVRRLAKRIAIGLDNELWLVLHLMIAGRLKWRTSKPPQPGPKGPLAVFDFSSGSLVLTEAGSKRGASLHVLKSADLDSQLPAGLEVLACSADEFRRAMTQNNHTLKRALTDQRIIRGIGNAYSDEILFRARLSPMRQSQRLQAKEIKRLYQAAQSVIAEWTQRLREEAGDRFPDKVTAFRPGMAVHGKYRQPCIDCGKPIQRIRYKSNETNYCAHCQNEGRLLADRALSRLLKNDWPKTVDELED